MSSMMSPCRWTISMCDGQLQVRAVQRCARLVKVLVLCWLIPGWPSESKGEFPGTVVCASTMYNQAAWSKQAFCLLRRFPASSDISRPDISRRLHQKNVGDRAKPCQTFLRCGSTGVIACVQRACSRCAKPCGALMQLVSCLLTI